MRRQAAAVAVAAALVGAAGVTGALAGESDFRDYAVDVPARFTLEVQVFPQDRCSEDSPVTARLVWPIRDGATGGVVHVDSGVAQWVAPDRVVFEFVLGEDTGDHGVASLRADCRGNTFVAQDDVLRTTGKLDLSSTRVQQGQDVTLSGAMPSQTTCAEGGTAWLHRNSDGVVFSEVDLDVNRSEVTATLAVPRDAATGEYNVIARCGDAWLSEDLRVDLRQQQVILPGGSDTPDDDSSADPEPTASSSAEPAAPQPEASSAEEPGPDDAAAPASGDAAGGDAPEDTASSRPSSDDDGGVDEATDDAALATDEVADGGQGGGSTMVLVLGGLVVLLVAVVAFLLGQRRPTDG